MNKEICKYDSCTGCMACVNVCTHHAIHIIHDGEGFDRPKIEEELCVNCGLCQKVCPINHHPTTNEPQKVYSGWSLNEEVRLYSSSGGAFSEIARPILAAGGVVFGCALNAALQAEHTYVETMEELASKLRGSKYVQSRIGDSYSQAKAFLMQGRKVLFSGTPCQIAGLKNYLHKEYEHLITVDLICHGVPSPLVFENYKEFMQHRENMKLTSVKFRCKKSSWIFFNMTLKGHVEKSGASKTYNGSYYDDPYIRGFLRDYFLRPSCHQCHFASTQRCSDFTIADWWGYKRERDEDKDYACKGVSLIMANTAKAVELVANMKMSLRERTVEEAKKTNKCLYTSFPQNENRESFWNDYRIMTFEELVSKYMRPERISWSVNLRQHYKNTDTFVSFVHLLMLPMRIINKIKKTIKVLE